MNECQSCGTKRYVIWSPLFLQHLCSFCLDKRTKFELENKNQAESQVTEKIRGLIQWLL